MEDIVGRMVFNAGIELKRDFEKTITFRSLTKTAVLKQFMKKFINETDNAIEFIFK